MPPLVYSPVLPYKICLCTAQIDLAANSLDRYLKWTKVFSDKVSLDSGNVAYIMVWDSQEHFPKCNFPNVHFTKR